MKRATAQRLTSFGVLVALAALWQLASILMPYESVPGEPMIPGWQILVTRTFLSLADYWQGGLGIPSVAQGGARTYAGAALAVLSNSWDTNLRLFAGLALGVAVGLIAGLAVSWSKWSRRIVALPRADPSHISDVGVDPHVPALVRRNLPGDGAIRCFRRRHHFLHRDGERGRQRLRYPRRLRAHAGSEPNSDLSLRHSSGDVP